MGANALKILKRDAVDRVSYRAEQREAILDEFERSGLKGAAFARIQSFSTALVICMAIRTYAAHYPSNVAAYDAYGL